MKISSLVASFLITLPLTVIAADNYELTIINHFNQPLDYTVGINPQVLPDLPINFTLNPSESIKTRVLDMQKESYIRLTDNYNHSAFFGVDIEYNQTHVHGYLDKGIAYSWDKTSVTFCTPEEYKKKHAC